MMRVIEVLSGLPLIFFVIFLTVVFGRNEYLLFLSIGAVGMADHGSYRAGTGV